MSFLLSYIFSFVLDRFLLSHLLSLFSFPFFSYLFSLSRPYCRFISLISYILFLISSFIMCSFVSSSLFIIALLFSSFLIYFHSRSRFRSRPPPMLFRLGLLRYMLLRFFYLSFVLLRIFGFAFCGDFVFCPQGGFISHLILRFVILLYLSSYFVFYSNAPFLYSYTNPNVNIYKNNIIDHNAN